MKREKKIAVRSSVSVLVVVCLLFPFFFCSLTGRRQHAKENSFYSSSDSEDEEEPRKFHVEIKPVQPNNGTHQNRATIDELKASVGNIVLSPPTSVRRSFEMQSPPPAPP